MSLAALITTKKTVFSIDDVAKIFKLSNKNYLKVLLTRKVKQKELIRIKRGIYTYTNDYNPLELANKIRRPSYISLQWVLFNKGVIFQDYSEKITSVTRNTFSIRIGGVEYQYSKIKDELLTDPTGVRTENGVRIASLERAICDTLYLYKNYYFDNLAPINRKQLLKIGAIFPKRVQEEVKPICSS